MKLGWTGHNLRKSKDTIEKESLDWNSQRDKRKKKVEDDTFSNISRENFKSERAIEL